MVVLIVTAPKKMETVAMSILIAILSLVQLIVINPIGVHGRTAIKLALIIPCSVRIASVSNFEHDQLYKNLVMAVCHAFQIERHVLAMTTLIVLLIVSKAPGLHGNLVPRNVEAVNRNVHATL